MASIKAGTYRRHEGVPDGFTPRRAPSVKPREVACPACEAAAGEPCVNVVGTDMTSVHRPRQRIAVRRQLESRDLDLGRWLDGVSGDERRATRTRLGLSQGEVSKFLGMSAGAFARIESGDRLALDDVRTAYADWLHLHRTP